MRKWSLYAASSLAAFALHAEVAKDDGWYDSTLFATAVVDVDSQGKISKLEILPAANQKLPASLTTLAETTMRQWEFVPATLNGAPAPAHTYLHVNFQLRKNGRDYDARVRYLSNGPMIEKSSSLRYPVDMIHARIQAELTMLAQVQPDGSLSNIRLESASSTLKHPVNEFVRSATIAMKDWHAKPETVAGHAVATWVRMPITYYLQNNVNDLRIDLQLERAVDSPADGPKTDAGVQALALDSPLKLKNQSP
ncbi:TonB family protein [Dyella humicola]|uniref:TonB family protein n=1 Tax=Dyella humicola TaxID=2992126 RepID=UPI00224D726E|nr:TonB family protein [Dyella humicola]